MIRGMDASAILVVGSINTDLVIRGARLPGPGETVLGGEFYQAAGGKGANQAVAAARAGKTPVTLIGAIGDDAFGRETRARFEAEDLFCDYLRVVEGQPSGVALILVDEQGQNLISVASGANAHLRPADLDAIPEAVFSSAKVFLTCLETPLEAVIHGLRRARRAGLLTILNPAPAPARPLPDDVLALVDVLVPNEIELRMLTANGNPSVPPDAGFATADHASHIREAVLQLQARGCRSVVVTLGKDGCLVADRTIELVPGRRVTAIDATAAGDAFCGALAVALAEGRSLGDAARWATAAASISVTRRGAQPSLATRDEIERVAAQR